APHGKILRIRSLATPLAEAEVVVPEGDGVIERFVVTPKWLFLSDLVGGPSRVRVLPIDKLVAGAAPKETRTIPLPAVAHVSELEAMADGEVVLRSETYTEPPAFLGYAASTGKTSRTALAETTTADMSDAVVTRET